MPSSISTASWRHVGRRALRHEAGAVAEDVEQRVDRVLHRAVAAGRGLQPARRGRRQLALRQAVDLVVHDDVGQVDVAADGVGHVAAADREPVAVAAGHQHQQVGVRQLDALRDRQRAAVHAVEPVGGRVAGDAARAADAGHERDLVRRPADVGQRAVDRLHDAEVAAPRAPDRLQVALVVLRLANTSAPRGSGRRRHSDSSTSGLTAQLGFEPGLQTRTSRLRLRLTGLQTRLGLQTETSAIPPGSQPVALDASRAPGRGAARGPRPG